jgi:hypothetical protein
MEQNASRQNSSTVLLKNNNGSIQSNVPSASQREPIAEKVVEETDEKVNDSVEQRVNERVNNTPIFLPKRPSDMTPIQIAEQLERDLQQLEGPIYASVLVPKPELERILGRTPPVLLLLADEHNGIENCESCVKPGCYSLYKSKGKNNNRSTFLDYLDDQTKNNWIIDVFFETWFGDSWRTSPRRGRSRLIENNPNNREKKYKSGGHGSALGGWSYIFEPCIGYIKNPYKNGKIICDYKHFRIQESDIRQLGFGNNTADNSFIKIMISLCDYIIWWCDGNSGKVDIIDLLEKKLSTIPDIPNISLIEFIDSIQLIYTDGSTIKDILEQPFFQKHSRTVHELKQLPPVIYNGIINNPQLGSAMIASYSHNIVQLCDIIRKTIKDHNYIVEFTLQKCSYLAQSAKYEELNELHLINFRTRLLDLYTIARMLKSFKKGYETSLYSQLAVGYFGANHTYHIELLLKQWYEPHVMWGTRNLKLLDMLMANHRQEIYDDIPKMSLKCIRQIKNDKEDSMYQLSNRLYDNFVHMMEFYSKSNSKYNPISDESIKEIEKIIKNKVASFAVFDPVEYYAMKNKSHLTFQMVADNFIKRYEDANPEHASLVNTSDVMTNQRIEQLYDKFVEIVSKKIIYNRHRKILNKILTKVEKILEYDTDADVRAKAVFDPIEFTLYQKGQVTLEIVFDNFIKRYEERYPEIVSSINASTQGGRRTRNNRSRRSRRTRKR